MSTPDPRRRVGRSRAVLLTSALALVVADALVVGTGVISSPGHHGPTVGVRVQKLPDPSDPTTTLPSASTTVPTTTASPSSHRSGTYSGRSYSGYHRAAATPPVSPPPCGSACVTLDATSSAGPVNHAGAGVNFVSGASGDGSSINALGTTMFRSAPAMTASGGYDWTSWDAAAGTGIPTTLILSNLWYSSYNGHPPTPWSDWTTYKTWVQTTVTNILASGQTVDYWDIYNEPGWRNYYSPDDYQQMTPGDLLLQFLVTYQVIKSIDPTAAIVGPSIGDLVFSPLPANDPVTHEPDITTFLNFAANHNLQLAAVAWHDNGQTPATLTADAQRVWALIQSHPSLGHPQMFLDEFASKRTQPIPGWDIGFLSMIQSAHVGSAVRSCWDGCQLSTLDGLMTSDGQPTTEYFERLAYAQMSGLMIQTSSTNPALAAIGAVNSGSRQVRALIGRMAGCAVLSWCQHNWWPTSETPVPAEDVQVNVNLPWNTPNVHVDLNCDPFRPGAASGGPIAVSPADEVLRPNGAGGEILSLTIPSFADGSAYSLVVTAG